MKTIKIKVTPTHIALGAHYKSRRCPVALAIMDAGAECVRVGIGHVSGIWNGYRFSSDTLDSDMEWIVDFDDGQPVSPFEFSLQVPDDFTAGPQRNQNHIT